jgi:hypothetical protein
MNLAVLGPPPPSGCAWPLSSDPGGNMQGGFATLVGSLKIRLVLQEQLHISILLLPKDVIKRPGEASAQRRLSRSCLPLWTIYLKDQYL